MAQCMIYDTLSYSWEHFPPSLFVARSVLSNRTKKFPSGVNHNRLQWKKRIIQCRSRVLEDYKWNVSLRNIYFFITQKEGKFEGVKFMLKQIHYFSLFLWTNIDFSHNSVRMKLFSLEPTTKELNPQGLLGVCRHGTIINTAHPRGQRQCLWRKERGKSALHVFLFIYYHCRDSCFIETMEERWCHDPHTSKGGSL